MIKKYSKESGFATIFILMLTAALLILMTFALKNMYSVSKQNKKDKIDIVKKVEQLNAKNQTIKK